MNERNEFSDWVPEKKDVPLQDIVRVYKILYEDKDNRSVIHERVREHLETDSESINLAVLAGTEVAQGEKPILVITNKGFQKTLLPCVFEMSSEDLSIRNIYYAEIENPEEPDKKVKARIIYSPFLKPKSENNLIISEGLKNQLGIEEGNEIRITDIYQDLSTVNLDDLYE